MNQEILGDYASAFWARHKFRPRGEDRSEDVNWHPLTKYEPIVPFMFADELEVAKQLLCKRAEESKGRINFRFVEKSYLPLGT